MLNDGDSVESLQMGRYDLMHTSTGEDLERAEALADAARSTCCPPRTSPT
nr:hypothetical protein [Candidatus Microthrix sp.]